MSPFGLVRRAREHLSGLGFRHMGDRAGIDDDNIRRHPKWHLPKAPRLQLARQFPTVVLVDFAPQGRHSESGLAFHT